MGWDQHIQLGVSSKQNHLKCAQDIENVHVLHMAQMESRKLVENNMQQELVNTHGTFGLRNSRAELIPEGWDQFWRNSASCTPC